MNLDQRIARHDGLGRKGARLAIAAGRVSVAGLPVRNPGVEVDRFSAVALDGVLLPDVEVARHVMLHKPAGILSATSDPVHRTVIDLIDRPWRESLHIAGRLDRASTGLVVLTNDGSWSKRIMAAAHAVTKTYVVETVHPIGPDAVDAFAAGFHFHTEDITTLPAELDILGERRAIVRLREGRYHQIKRMFHRTGNRVAALHRMAIGPLVLDPALAPGEWRMLSAAEVAGM